MLMSESASINKCLFTIIFFLVICILSLKNVTTMAQPIWYDQVCQNDTAVAPSKTYQSNLNLLLSTLSSKAATNGFGKTTVGNGSDNNPTIYGQYLCRPDTSNVVCQYCVMTSAQAILTRCPNRVTAILWYNYCNLRYSNVDFFGTVAMEPSYSYYNISINGDEHGTIAKRTVEFMKELILNATAAEPGLLSAVNELDLSDAMKCYGIVQCVKDINASECRRCLQGLLREDGGDRMGVRLLCPSCMMRREAYNFFQVNLTTASSANSSAGTGGNEFGTKRRIVVISITSLLSLTAILVSIYYVWGKCCRVTDEVQPEKGLLFLQGNTQSASEDSLKANLPMIPLSVIQHSTNYFSDESKLGEGGFGPVYKGTLPDGRHVAVKRLSKSSNQGLEEFRNEVIFIAKLQHRNLVRILGCCVEENEKLLVYEYMSNASLDSHLFDREKKKELDWKLRWNIIHGITRGLCYLHEDSSLRLIHRDLKASNILLDNKMNPKISDFGLARTIGIEDSQSKTRRVVGTFGYMAPEYVMVGVFSIKSDVYSFGVLLLEIISGKKNNGHYFLKRGQSLLVYAWRLWNEGKALTLMDPLLESSYTPSEVAKCIHIALLCVQEDPEDRPTMPAVIVMLSSDAQIFSNPKQPAFSVGKETIEQESCVSNNSNSHSINVATISTMEPR